MVYARVGVANLVDGYNLDGSVFPGANLDLAAFVAGAGPGPGSCIAFGGYGHSAGGLGFFGMHDA
jgi:hypothetical protein